MGYTSDAYDPCGRTSRSGSCTHPSGGVTCSSHATVGAIEAGLTLRSPLSLALGLPGHGPLHVIGQVDVLDFYNRDFHAPRAGMLVDDTLQSPIDFFPLRQEFVEFGLSQNSAERRLGELAGRVSIMLYLKDRLHRIDDAKIDDRVDLNGDVCPW